MNFTKYFLIYFLFCIKICIGNDEFKNLCKRIYFKQPNSHETLASKEIINGVYLKTSITVDKFPVYKHERGNVYFQYNLKLNKFFFSNPYIGVQNYSGLNGDGNSYKMKAPYRWVNDVSQRTDDIFKNIITKWYQYYYSPAPINLNYPLKSKLVATCVDFADCQFQNIAFTQTIGKKFTIDIFTPLENVYTFDRQVYKHNSTTNIYLFFDKNRYWSIGTNYTSDLVSWSVFDQALKPELITGTWRKWSGTKWENQYGAKIECSGVNKTCSDLICQNNGTCHSNRYNNSFCSCPFDYNGISCEKKVNKQEVCPSTSFTNFLLLPGAVESVFCSSGQNVFYNTLCKKDAKDNTYKWISESKCKPKTTPRTFTTTTRRVITRRRIYPTRRRTIWPTRRIIWPTRRTSKTKKFNADDHIWIMIVVLIVIITVPLVGPAFACYCCKMGYGRLTSLWWYITMWLFLIYKIVAYAANLSQYGKVLFSVMDYTTTGLIILFYLYVLFQSFCSNEKEYVQSSFEGDEVGKYFNNIIAEKPSLYVSIICYHYETRTRLVTYTDANGNLQTRTETYQEKVTTFTGSKEFLFKSWRDVSNRNNLPVLTEKVLRIKVSKELNFAEDETRDSFNRFKEEYIEENRYRDVYIDHSVDLNINGFKERVMGSEHKPPCWINSWWLFLAHLLLLGWPYRWLLNGKTDKAEFTVEKEISIYEDRYNASAPVFTGTHPVGNLPNEPPPPYESHADYPMVPLGTNNHGYRT